MRRHSPLFITIMLFAAPAAAAQALDGRAVDRETLRPVSAAFVVMLDSAGQPVAAARTDSAGAFSLAAPEPGLFALNVQRAGFGRTLTPAVPLRAGETMAVEVRMAPLAEDAEPRPTRRGITGSLLDDRTGLPVAGARISLLNAREQRVSNALTDSMGGFHFSLAASGAYLLHAEAAGYQPARSTQLTLTARDSVRVQLRVATDAVLLTPLNVVAGSPRLVRDHQLEQFEERRRTAVSGRFLGPEEIERIKPFYATDALQQVPFVHVDRVVMLPVRSGLAAGALCVANLYVDGIRASAGALNDLVRGSSLLAVEVYPTAAQAPGAFPALANRSCGVVVVWSTAGGRPRVP